MPADLWQRPTSYWIARTSVRSPSPRRGACSSSAGRRPTRPSSRCSGCASCANGCRYQSAHHDRRRVNGSQKQQLETIAREAMRANGFEPDFPPAAEAQARAGAQPPPSPAIRDLRDLPWSSIDNDDSRDLDQIEVCLADGGRTRVLVGIADVDVVVAKSTPLDDHARKNTTSVYTPAIIFPMLPPELSTDRTSLNEAADRHAIVIDMTVSPDGSVSGSDVYRAIVRNQAQLTYSA